MIFNAVCFKHEMCFAVEHTVPLCPSSLVDPKKIKIALGSTNSTSYKCSNSYGSEVLQRENYVSDVLQNSFFIFRKSDYQYFS